VWGSSADDVFVVGHTGTKINGAVNDNRIMHFNGNSWSEETEIGISERLNGIWGNTSDDVFAVGSKGLILHYDGTQWSAMEPEKSRTTFRKLNAVWGRSGSEVYAVGNRGTILYYNGQRWSAMSTPTKANLYGVWADRRCSRIFAVGSTGTILVYFNGRWSKMASKTRAQLTAVWGTPCDGMVFAVGSPRADRKKDLRYTLLRFDGREWSPMSGPVVIKGRGKLHSLWGTSDTNVYAVGNKGIILHCDGEKWTEMPDRPATCTRLRATSDFLSIWGSSSKQVYAVGRNGAIYNYKGKSWKKGDSGSSGRPIERLTKWNSVTGLEFAKDERGRRHLLASTLRQGVFFSPDRGGRWTNLSAPPYPLYGLQTGSIYVQTYGVYTFAGPGLILGWVKDKLTGMGLPNGSATTDSGLTDDTDASGYFRLSLGAGNYHLTGAAPHYKSERTEEAIPSLPQGNLVIFDLWGPILNIKINGTPMTASNNIFEHVQGQIQAAEGDFECADGDAYVQVPYPNGWVKLVIKPESGFQVENVLSNTPFESHGAAYTLSDLEDTQSFEVKFGAYSAACPPDFNKDGDVDGADLWAADKGLTSVSLTDLAGKFGQPQCP